MKLGLITDIHEQTQHLRTALSLFRKKDVEQVVVIGDVCEMGERIEETCRLLAEANAIGVWVITISGCASIWTTTSVSSIRLW